MRPVHLNGTEYRRSARPVAVVCIDGGDPAYIERGLEAGMLPTTARFVRDGFSAIADGTMPSFTCPNNLSLVTGAPPSVHGLFGNYCLNERAEAVAMTRPELLRSRTILAEFADAGAQVASIAAKDKLRRQLGKDLGLSQGSISFSAELADRSRRTASRTCPNSPACRSPTCIRWNSSCSCSRRASGSWSANAPSCCFSRSPTDYIQHEHAPGDPVADEFCRRIDGAFGRLARLGAVVALTADHGMNDTASEDGRPNVIFLQDILDRAFGVGDTKVICPITDAFVKHHGALGEARVPFILSHPRNAAYARRAACAPLRSHQIFDFAINGTKTAA